MIIDRIILEDILNHITATIQTHDLMGREDGEFRVAYKAYNIEFTLLHEDVRRMDEQKIRILIIKKIAQGKDDEIHKSKKYKLQLEKLAREVSGESELKIHLKELNCFFSNNLKGIGFKLTTYDHLNQYSIEIKVQHYCSMEYMKRIIYIDFNKSKMTRDELRDLLLEEVNELLRRNAETSIEVVDYLEEKRMKEDSKDDK